MTQTQNSMDLSQVKDIDTSTVESGACCCATGHDEVLIILVLVFVFGFGFWAVFACSLTH